MKGLGNVWATPMGIVLVGALIGAGAVLLQWMGNPGNMGVCVACFNRDIAGGIGLHRAAVGQYLRPEIIGMVLGLLVFLTGFRFPDIVEQPIEYIADLNTPIPMFIIGYYLGNLHWKDLTSNKKQYIAILLRTIGVPFLTMAIMLPFHIDPVVFIAVTIASCSPVAAKAAMFATKYDKNPQLGSEMVSVSTLMSLITMPLVITASEIIIH